MTNMINCFCCYIIKSAAETAKKVLLSVISNLLLIQINISQIRISDNKHEEVLRCARTFYFYSFWDFSGIADSVILLRCRMYYKPTEFDENRWSHFWENENFNFFMWTSLNFDGRSKTKKWAKDICKRTLDIKCERNWSVGLGAMLGDGQKIKNYFSSFRDFFGKNR